MEGHAATVTCLAISLNSLFVVSGSEDFSVRVWGLTIGAAVCSYLVSNIPYCTYTFRIAARLLASARCIADKPIDRLRVQNTHPVRCEHYVSNERDLLFSLIVFREDPPRRVCARIRNTSSSTKFSSCRNICRKKDFVSPTSRSHYI